MGNSTDPSKVQQDDRSRFTRNLAVLVGINEYGNGLPQLTTPVNDATHFAELLQSDHGYEVRLLIANVTKTSLEILFRDELPGEIEPDDRVLVYFAGHGVALNGDDGPRGYLVPQDARSDDAASLLAMADLHQWLTNLPCRHMLAILDCCFAGAFRWTSMRQIGALPEVIHKERFDRYLQSPAWQAITSSSYDQKALDILTGSVVDSLGTRQEDGFQHSPFAHALFAALKGEADLVPRGQGDGVITATELAAYLRQEVEVKAAQQANSEQTPQLWPLNKHGKGEYIFLVPNHPLNLPKAEELSENTNPYRGLKPYERNHRDLFFGRKTETETLMALLEHRTFVAVLGASGTGKSSLVKAGLLPRLEAAGSRWLILPPIRPTDHPVRALRNLLREVLPGIPIALDAADGLAQAIVAWKSYNPNRRLVLTLDQYEELVTLCYDDTERTRFLDLLAEAVQRQPDAFRLIIALRTDFEPQFADTPLFQSVYDHAGDDLLMTGDQPEQLGVSLVTHHSSARYVIPPLDHAALRDVIEGPASVRVLYFEPPELVDQLIREVVQMPGALPLLSFTLSEMYIRYLRSGREDRSLQQADYEALRGVVGSLRMRATELYNTLPDDAHRATMQRVMLRMISAEGGELARRRVTLSELEYPTAAENFRVQTVLSQLVEARLIVRGSAGQRVDVTDAANFEVAEPYVEPAHDALVTAWDRLAQWKREADEYLLLQRRAAQASLEWERAPEAEKAGLLWNDDPRLPQLERILTLVHQPAQRRLVTGLWRALWPDVATPSTTAWLNRRELAFAQASVWRRAAVVRRIVSITMAVIIALAGLAVVAIVQAELARVNAVEAQLQAAVAGSRQLAAQSRTYLQSAPDLALLLAVEGSHIHETLEAKGSLLDSLRAGATLQPVLFSVLKDHDTWVMDVAFSPTGGMLASAGADSQIVLWDVATRQRLARLDCGRVVRRIVFNPDGKWLAAALTNGDILLWDVAARQLIEVLAAHQADVRALAFSPDGRILASGGDDGKILLWDVASTSPADNLLLSDGEAAAHDIAFSPDGRLLAAGTNKGTLAIWNVLSRVPIQEPIEAHATAATGVAFSPDGKLLVTAGLDRQIRLWNVESWQPLDPPLEGHESSINDVLFSPDGTLVASASNDNRVILWDVTARVQHGSSLGGHNAAVFAVSFSPDGSLLASAGKDGAITLWQLSASASPLAEVLTRDTSATKGVSFSEDGNFLVSSDDAGGLRFWDVVERRLMTQVPNTVNGLPNGLGLSPDGSVVAVSDSEGAIYLLDSETGQRQSRLHVAAAAAFGKVAFSSDGTTVAIGDEDGSVTLWDLASGEQKGEPLQGGQVAIMSVAFNSDRSMLAAGDDNGNVYLWDLTNQRLHQQYPSLHQDTVLALAFSPDSNLLVSGSIDRRIVVIDLTTGVSATRALVRHSDWVYALAFDPSSTILASGSRDDTILLWDVATGETLGAALTATMGDVFSLAFSPDGKLLSAGSGGPETLTLWDVDLASWQERACHIANRNLSKAEWERFIGMDVPYRCTCPNFLPGKDAVGCGN